MLVPQAKYLVKCNGVRLIRSPPTELKSKWVYKVSINGINIYTLTAIYVTNNDTTLSFPEALKNAHGWGPVYPFVT